MADRVRAEFPEGVPEIEMDALAARLRNPAMPIAEESKIRIVK
jgi:hypothetical protein